MNDECRGFHWIGQSFSHCDNCGRDIVDHDGLDWIKPGGGPFRQESELIPFPEAEARIRLFADQVIPLSVQRGAPDDGVRRYHESQRGAS